MLQIKNIKELIATLLKEQPHLRDDDKQLIWAVWEHEAGRTMGIISIDQFVSYTSPESIRRCRQQLQQMRPELRGETYLKRHGKLEPEAKREVQDEKWSEIEKINEDRLEKHSEIYKVIYKNNKIPADIKKQALDYIKEMETDNCIDFNKWTYTLETSFIWKYTNLGYAFWEQLNKYL